MQPTAREAVEAYCKNLLGDIEPLDDVVAEKGRAKNESNDARDFQATLDPARSPRATSPPPAIHTIRQPFEQVST